MSTPPPYRPPAKGASASTSVGAFVTTAQPGVPCDAVTEIPTAMPTDPGVVQRTGYPDDCLARCCRLAGHDGKHFVALALASGPGSFSMSWGASE